MSNYDRLQFGNVVTFEVYPASILGARFGNVKVLAMLDKDSANTWIDADAVHVNVFPTLPSGTPDNANEYQYLKFKHVNGNIGVIGLPWIREDSITVNETGTLTISIENVSPSDKEIIINALSANGYNAVSTTLS